MTMDPANRGAEVMRDEASVLNRVADSLSGEFVTAVDLLVGCTGKVVLSGIGKSGRIAEKIAATMSSLGLPAVFLHSTEALHGDIGLVQSGDVVFVISNSGTTREVLDIIPTLRWLGVPVISITRSAESPLALASDVRLVVDSVREADALNLAPTSSTTGVLALGDALAVVASERRGFTPDDFGRRHPAGALGKKLAASK